MVRFYYYGDYKTMAERNRGQEFLDAAGGDLLIPPERAYQESKALFEGKLPPVFPEYSTGARAKLLINGKTIGAALEVTYSINTTMTEVRTIDQFLPWEIVPGQMMIKASLKRIVDPRRTLGGDGLFATMQSYLHQPYASLEIRDRLGNLIFYARGMFTDFNGSIQAGQASVEGVSFVGYYWRENTIQTFNPEPESSLDRLKNQFTQNSLVRRISGLSF